MITAYRLSTFTLVVLAIIHLFLGVWWLALFFTIVLAAVWLEISQHCVAKRFRRTKVIAYSCLFSGVFILGITLQTLFFGVYYIPSESMERTLHTGDRVWVNRLCYGPRLPENPYQIPWVNILFWLAKGRNVDLDRAWWSYTRLKGYTKPKIGDIILFNPPQANETFIKRCVAGPSDTIEIINGQVFVNGEHQLNYPTVAHNYSITYKANTYPQRLIDSLGIKSHCIYVNHNCVKVALTNDELNRVTVTPQVISCEISISDPVSLNRIYPSNKQGVWSIDNYGPYIVPFKGMQTKLNAANKLNYQNLIQQYEDYCYLLEDSIFTFGHNYYFMMGDNRHNSNDSRNFGPIPEKCIVGRATIKLFSRGKKPFSIPFSNL